MKSASTFAFSSTLLFIAACHESAFAQDRASAQKIRIVCVTDVGGKAHPALEHSTGYRELDRAAMSAAKTWPSCSSNKRKSAPSLDATERKPTRVS